MPARAAAVTVAAMLLRRLASTLLLTALLATTTAAVAQPAAAQVRHARFLVKFDGTVHTVWSYPRSQVAQDCYRTSWYQANGEETWHVASTGENRVLMTSNGVATQLHIGNWSEDGDDGSTRTGLVAKGQITRSRTDTTSFTAGTCGVLQEPWQDPPPKQDCGTRLVNYEVELAGFGRAVAITPDVLTDGQNGVREKLGYDNCALVTPSNVLAGTWPAATGAIKAKGKALRHYFGRERSFTATAHQSWDGKLAVPGGDETSTTTIDWKLTFTRVRG
jgi:hypothetical protein